MSRCIVLYNYKGSICTAAFLDRNAARMFFVNNPGVIVAMKDIEINEGDGINQVY